MSVPNQIIRIYNTDDASLIQFARTTNAHLIAHLAEFTAFDADFTLPFSTAFTADIAAAESFSSDAQLIDVQVQDTLNVEGKMKDCRDCFQNMKYFIEKAFPNKPGTWSEFGYNDYENSRRSHDKMIQFMHDLFESATKYQTQLTAAGFPLPAQPKY